MYSVEDPNGKSATVGLSISQRCEMGIDHYACAAWERRRGAAENTEGDRMRQSSPGELAGGVAGDPKASIRILHRCNFRCPACSTFSGPDCKGMMSLVDFCKAVEILATERFQGQLNVSGGEPTLHPALEAMLA